MIGKLKYNGKRKKKNNKSYNVNKVIDDTKSKKKGLINIFFQPV